MKFEKNILDNIISYISPKAAVERVVNRGKFNALTSYKGASTGRRQTSEWSTLAQDADSDTLYDIPTLRQRSRDLDRNVDFANGVINQITTATVGTGLRLQSRVDGDALGLSIEQTREVEKAIEREWRIFSDTTECDVYRTSSFYSLQTLAFRSVLVSGDCFANMPFITRRGSPYSLKLQLIEADRVANENWGSDTEKIRGGVEKDRNGAPLYYYVANHHPTQAFYQTSTEWQKIRVFGASTGKRIILHLFEQLRPGQTRGVPLLAPCLETFKMLGEYADAELMAATIASYFTAFVETESGDDGGLGLMQPTSNIGGSSSDTDYKMGPGAIIDLAQGESVKIASSDRPNAGYADFVFSKIRDIGMSVEVPVEVLIGNYDSSYSASRAALSQAEKTYAKKRKWFSEKFCQPVFENFLFEAIGLGRINAPGFFQDPSIRRAYSRSEWIGPSQHSIDPTKEIAAARDRIELGVTTHSEETAKLTGGDWESKQLQLAKERALIKELSSKNEVESVEQEEEEQNQ